MISIQDRFTADDGQVVGQPIEIKPAIGDPRDFPVEALSPRLRGAVEAIVDIAQVPSAIAAQSILGACSLVAQSRIMIELPTRETVPPTLFLFTVAASGDRKSACDRLALKPVYDRESDMRASYEQRQLQYSIDKIAYDAAITKSKSGAKNRDEIRENLESCGAPPVAPPQPMLLVEDPTVEGIVKLLDEAYPSLGLFSDEGAKMLGGYSMQDERRASTGAALSQFWDGKPVKRVRGGEVAKFMSGRRVSLHLMVQPGVAMKFFGDKSLRDQGMLSRMLVAFPRSLKGSRLWKDPKPESWAALGEYHSRLNTLLGRAFELMDPETHALTFANVQLQPDAADLWKQFSDNVERQQGPGQPLEEVSDLASKIAQHAARLAGCIAYFENSGNVANVGISLAAMNAGIQISQFYLDEALRLYNAGSIDDDSDNAQALIEFIRKQELKQVGLRWLSQRAPKPIRPAKILKRAVEFLVDAGHLHPIKGGAIIEIGGKSQFQKEAFAVVYGDRP